MLVRHTGTQQLLCPACGVALGCLWAPSVPLLCCTALQPCALQRLLKKTKNKTKRGFHSIWRRYLPGDRGRIEFPLKKMLPRALLISGNYRYREIRILGIFYTRYDRVRNVVYMYTSTVVTIR